MSEFKIRPTPSLMKLILEQLGANGVDVSQNQLVLQESLPRNGLGGRTERDPVQPITGFLRNVDMPIAMYSPQANGLQHSGARGKVSLSDFLAEHGLIITQPVERHSDKITLDLAKMREIAAQGFEYENTNKPHLSKAGRLLAGRREAGANRQIA